MPNTPNTSSGNNVEERIVAAKFDASDFEKGVNKTIKKLDELNEKLDFKKTGESITELSKKAKDAQESTAKSVEKLTDRYTTFVGMMKQKLLSGFADQVVGVFFKLEKAALNFAKSMTFDQISAGLGKYESMLTAVRMITNSYKTIKNEITGVAERIHYTQDEAYTAMRHLQDYADETSYSIEQMSDSMSKMVAAGVSLEQAEKNVQGIANACANAGVNATDAARAFFNLSQAYSSGGLKYTDYRSLELLNMTNESFQNQLIAAGVAAGTLKEVKVKNGAKAYKTQRSATNQKVTAGKTVTKQGLTESLKYGWAGNDVMDYLFGNSYYVDVNDFYDVKDQTEKLRGKAKTEERKRLLSQMQDSEAIKKHIDSLKDDDEIKKAYKELTDDDSRAEYIKRLQEEAEQIDKIAQKYDGLDTSSIKEVFGKLDENDERRVAYRQLKTEKERTEYLKTLEENANLVGEYLDKEKKAISIVDSARVEDYVQSLSETDERRKQYEQFGETPIGQNMRKAYIDELSKDTKMIKELQSQEVKVTEEGMRKYLESLDANNKYRQKYEKMDSEGQQKYIKELTKNADIAEKANKKRSGLDEDALDKYIMSLDKSNARRQKYEKMSTAERKKYLKSMADEAAALGKIGRKYDDIAIEAFLAAREARNLNDVIKAVGDYVSSKWTKVFENLIGQLDDASDFFTDLSEGGIASLFTDFADWIADVSDAFNEGGVGSANFRNMILSLDSGLGNLLGIFNDLLPSTSDFGYQLMVISGDLSVAMQNFDEWTQKVRAWMNEETRLAKVQGIFANLSGTFMILGKTLGVAFNIIEKTLHVLAPILDAMFAALNKLTEPIARLGARENTEPFEKLQNAIDNFFKVITPLSDQAAPFIEKFGEILGIIGDFFISGAIDTAVMNINFFADAFSLLLELLGVKTVQAENGRSVLQGLKEDITGFGDSCKEAIGAVSSFFTSLFDDLRELFGFKPKDGEDAITGSDGYFSRIKNFFDTNEFIQNAEKWLTQAKTDIQTWFANLPTTISTWFTETFQGKKQEVKKVVDGKEIISYEFIKTPLQEWIDNFGPEVEAWFNKAIEDVKVWFKELPGKISSFFAGFLYEEKTVTDYDENGVRTKVKHTVETPLKKWLDEAITSVSNFIANIPTYIVQALGKGLDVFGMLINAVFGTKDENANKDTKTKSAGDAVSSWSVTFIDGLRTAIQSLPAKIKELFAKAKAKFKQAFETIKTWFNSSETGVAIKEWAIAIVDDVKKFILNLPETIKNIVKTIGSFGRSIVNTFKELFSGKEVGEAVEEELAESVQSISLGGILQSIADIGATIVNQFLSWFTGTEDIGDNTQWFIDNVIGFLNAIPSKLWETVQGIASSISEAFGYVVRSLTTQEDANANKKATPDEYAEKHPYIASLIDAATSWIKSIPKAIEEAYESIKTRMTNVWDGISKLFAKNDRLAEINSEINDASTNPARRNMLIDEYAKLQSAQETDFEKNHPAISGLITSAQNWITNIPGRLDEAWKGIQNGLSEFFATFVEYWNSLGAGEGETADPTKFEEDHPLLAKWVADMRNWIISIPDSLSSAFSEASQKITTFFSEFGRYWQGVTHERKLLSEIADYQKALADENDPEMQKWLNGEINKRQNELLHTEETEGAFYSKFNRDHPVVSQMMGTMAGWVTDVPGIISSTWNSVIDAINKFWEDLVKAFKGDNISEDVGEGEQSLGQKLRNAIVSFFADLPGIITQAIADAIELISEGISTLTGFLSGAYAEGVDGALNTDDLTENVVASLEQVGEKTEAAVQEATENVGEAAESAETPKDGLTNGIVRIGQAFWEVITKTIPEFIKSGFTYVKDNWKDWIGGLKDIFQNVTGVEIDMTTIKTSIQTAFENLPQTIMAAWESAKGFVENLFKNDKEPIPWSAEQLLNSATIDQSAKDQIIRNLEKSGYDVSKYTKQSSIFSSIMQFGTDIGESLKSILMDVFNNIGPWLLQGWNNGIDMLGKVFGSLGKWLSGQTDNLGDAVNDVVGDGMSEENKSLIQRIGETITTFITETIPEFIGSAIGTLINELPGMWDKFWGAFMGAYTKTGDEETKKKEKELQQATDSPAVAGAMAAVAETENVITEILKGFTLGTVTTGAAVLAGLIVIMKILEFLKDVIGTFDATGNLAERAQAKNSIEAVFKRMLTALIAGMALVVYASQLDETQFDRAKSVLDELSIFLGILATFYSVTKVADDIKEIKAGNAAAGALTGAASGTVSRIDKLKNVGVGILESAGDAIGSFMKTLGVTTAIGAGTEIIGTSISDVLTQLLGDFGMIGPAVEGFANGIGDGVAKLTEIKENVSAALKVMTSIGTLVNKIAKIKDQYEAVEAAQSVATLIATPLTTLMQAFKGEVHAEELVSALDDVLSMTGRMDEFVKFVNETDTFAQFKWALTSLVTALSFYNMGDAAKGISTLTDDDINSIASVLKRLVQNEGMLSLLRELTPEKMGVSVTETQEGIEILLAFATALQRLADGVKGFDETTKQNLIDFFGTLSEISSNVVDENNNMITFAAQMEALGGGLAALSRSIKAESLTAADVSIASSALNMVADLGEKMSHIGVNFWDVLTTGGTTLQTFALQLATVGQDLQKFMGYMHPVAEAGKDTSVDWDLTAVASAMYALNQLTVAASRLKQTDVDALKSLLENGGSIGGEILGFMANLVNVHSEVMSLVPGLDAPTFGFNDLPFESIYSMLDAFDHFAGAISKLGSINLSETIMNLSGYRTGPGGIPEKMYDSTTQQVFTLKMLAIKIYTAFEYMTRKMGDGSLDVDKINDFLTLFGTMMDAIGSAYSYFDLKDPSTMVYVSPEEMLTNMLTAATIIRDNAEEIFSVIDTIAGHDQTENIDKANHVFSLLKLIGESLSLFGGSIRQNWYDVTGYGKVDHQTLQFSGIAESMTELQTLAQNSELLTTTLDTLFGNLSAALDNTKTVESMNQIGYKTATLISTGIQSAFDSGDAQFHPQITPVLADGATESIKQQLADIFGVNYNQEFNLSTAFAESVRQAFGDSETFVTMSETLNSINDKLDALSTSDATKLGGIVLSLQGEMTAVKDAFASMGVYIDRDALVGAIEPALTARQDQNINYYLGHVTTGIITLPS